MGQVTMQVTRRIRLFTMAVTLGVLAPTLSSTASATDAPPLSAYGELPAIEDAAVSPSGDHIAALITVQGKRMLAAFDSDGKVVSMTSVDAMKVRNFSWIGEQKILLTYSVTENLSNFFVVDKAELTIAVTIPISDSASGQTIFGNRRQLVDSIFGNYGIRQIDGRWYGFFGALELSRGSRNDYVWRHGRPFLYRVDLQDYKTKRVALAADTDHDNDWLIDAKRRSRRDV